MNNFGGHLFWNNFHLSILVPVKRRGLTGGVLNGFSLIKFLNFEPSLWPSVADVFIRKRDKGRYQNRSSPVSLLQKSNQPRSNSSWVGTKPPPTPTPTTKTSPPHSGKKASFHHALLTSSLRLVWWTPYTSTSISLISIHPFLSFSSKTMSCSSFILVPNRKLKDKGQSCWRYAFVPSPINGNEVMVITREEKAQSLIIPSLLWLITSSPLIRERMTVPSNLVCSIEQGLRDTSFRSTQRVKSNSGEGICGR